MNNAQDMSPDFVLMRLVSAAEDDRLEAENGNLPTGGAVVGLGKDGLAHSGVKSALDISRGPTAGLEPPSSLLNKGQPRSETTAAPDSGGTEDRAPLCPRPQLQSSMEPQGFDFVPGTGLRPQLLVFSNIMRNGEGISDSERLNTPMDVLERGPGSDCTGAAVNNTLSPGDVQRHHGLLDQGPSAAQASAPSSAETPGAAEQCHRHRFITGPHNWPLLSDRSRALPPGDSSRGQEEAVFELARRFDELRVGAVPRMLFKGAELPRCSCQGAQGSVDKEEEPRHDPTETSDALLVLEGLGSRDIHGLGMEESPEGELDDENGHNELLLERKREIMQKMSGAFSISSFQVELRREIEKMGLPATQEVAAGSEGSTQTFAKISTPGQNSPWTTTSNHSQASTPRRAKRCSSAPRTPTYRAAGGEKTFKVPGKSKKNSLKTRLSKLFRTKSYSGSTHVLDKRLSVSYSVSSAMSLVDMERASGAEQDADRWKIFNTLCIW